VFGVGIAMTALLTLVTPLAAYTRVELFIFLRALEGFFEVSTDISQTIARRDKQLSVVIAGWNQSCVCLHSNSVKGNFQLN